MKRKHSAHARYAILAGTIVIAVSAALILALSDKAGGNKGTQSKSPRVAARVPSPSLPIIQLSSPEAEQGSDTVIGYQGMENAPNPNLTSPVTPPGSGDRTGRPVDIPVPLDLHHAMVSWCVQQAIRNNAIGNIDAYLARKGSPLAGTGATWLECSERYGIPYSLAIGICGQESYFGRQCFRPYNAGGLMQYPHDYFSSWEQYIDAQYLFLSVHFGHPQVAEDCPGYCEGTPQSWLNGVNGVREEVEAL